jgi:integrase
MEFVAFVEEYMENVVESSVEQTTWEGYMSIVKKHIIPYFRGLKYRIKDINPIHLQKYFAKKYKDDKLNANTLKRHRAVLKRIFQYAVKNKIIEYNPILGVEMPKVESEKELSYYSVDELKTLIEASKGAIIESAVFLTSFYGLRRGEVLGLRWKDIDFENKTISIKNTRTKVSKAVEKKPKTKSSKRELPMTESVIEYLQNLKTKQEDDKKLFGNTYIKNDYIVKYDNGKLISTCTFNRTLSKIMEDNNLRHIRLHDLRHSVASYMNEQGVSLKVIQEWLGHSDIQTTARIYVHVGKEQKKNTALRMEEALKNSITLENTLEKDE